MTGLSMQPRAAVAPSPGRADEPDRHHPLDIVVTAAYVLIGFTPIATLALSLLEVAPLRDAAPATITAATSFGLYLAVLVPDARPLVLRGLATGLAAVLIYDGTRLPFVILGGWPDFIPRIGGWLLDDPDAHWSIGYLWRYLGNGAGMGLAFTVLAPRIVDRLDPRVAGIGFGVAVWTGLLTVLALSPNGQDKMFQLTPATFALSLLGHVVYGSVLGWSWPRGRPGWDGLDRPQVAMS